MPCLNQSSFNNFAHYAIKEKNLYNGAIIENILTV